MYIHSYKHVFIYIPVLVIKSASISNVSVIMAETAAVSPGNNSVVS